MPRKRLRSAAIVPRTVLVPSGVKHVTIRVAASPSLSVVSVAQPFGAHSFGNAKVLVTGTDSTPATMYRVTASPGGLLGFGATPQVLVDRLTGGTAYTFTIARWDGSAWSAESAASSSFTPTTSPDVPTGINANPADTSAIVSFLAPASNGGSAVTLYHVANHHDWDRVEVTGASSPITVTGLTNGVAYSFIVWASNAVGDSLDSSRSNIVTPPSGGGGTNYALSQPVTVSSTFGSGFEAAKAVDGNSGTRWASQASGGTEWIYVDLGAAHTISEIALTWDPSYATSYKIQTSPDFTAWTDVFSTTTGNGGSDVITVSATARYWRVLCLASATTLYSIFELEVRGP